MPSNWVLVENDENMAPKRKVILLDLQQKINAALGEITRTFLAVLKA